jgi:hypothetical protein
LSKQVIFISQLIRESRVLSWGCSSRGRVSVLQELNHESKPQYHQKEKENKKRKKMKEGKKEGKKP